MELTVQTSKTFNDIQKGKKLILLRGGTRSGKSYSAIQWLIVKALEERCVVSVVRKSFPSLRISALRDFKTIMSDLGIWEDDRWLATENSYTFENGTLFEFLSVQDSERRKGTKRDYLFIDEANELDYEDFFQLFIRTTHKTILAFNPNFPINHWIYTQAKPHPEADEYISTFRDNPFLEWEIVQEIERLKTISPSYYKIYGEGEIGVTEGLVFDNIHIMDTVPEGAELSCYGIDFGYSSDPTALIAMYKWEDGILFDELVYMRGLLSNQIANFCLAAYENRGRNEVIADSSDPRLIEEIFRYGVNIKGAVKGRDSIKYGIDIMKQHKIWVTKGSTNLLEEFYSYLYQKDKNGVILSDPIDMNNHGLDACRYAAVHKLGSKGTTHGKYVIRIK